MFQTYNFGLYQTSTVEFFIATLFFFILLIYGFFYQNLKVSTDQVYKYYTFGLAVKLIGSFLYYSMYAHYYAGGDTTQYFEISMVYRQVFVGSPSDFFQLMIEAPSRAHYAIFWKYQVWPFEEIYYVPTQMSVIKMVTPFVILSNGSFLLSTMMVGFVSFFAVWKLYKSFQRICPNMKYNFIACFLIPSSVFWAGGISKDTVTLIGVALMISELIELPYKRSDKKLWAFITIAIGFILVVLAKPYVVVALFPAVAIWQFSGGITKRFSQKWLRSVLMVLTSSAALGVSVLFLSLIGESLGKFALDQVVEQTVVYHNDLKSDYHKGQSFDIGKLEPNLQSLISKIPIAAFAGIFYPLPGQVAGLVPNISTIEGASYLLVIIYLLFNIYVLRKSYEIPVEKKVVVNFFLIFSIVFCIVLGLSTSNFGALVRFRVPALPFLSGFLLIHIYYLHNHSYIKSLR